VRICRVVVDSEPCFGVLEGVDADGRARDDAMVALVSGTPFTSATADGRVLPLRETRLLAPVVPSKIVAVGRNYLDHAKEMGNDVPAEPLIFLKPSTSVIGPDDPIRLPWQSERVEHEGELAIVIGRLCRNVTAENALDHVLGYTCANDVTARDLQRSDGQWSRAKGFDSFCPLGPWIQTEVDLDEARITCSVNGEVRQQGTLGDMIFDIPQILVHISAAMTLLPGDVVLTGTPAGVGPLGGSDRVEVSIEGIGVLSNPVVDHA